MSFERSCGDGSGIIINGVNEGLTMAIQDLHVQDVYMVKLGTTLSCNERPEAGLLRFPYLIQDVLFGPGFSGIECTVEREEQWCKWRNTIFSVLRRRTSGNAPLEGIPTVRPRNKFWENGEYVGWIARRWGSLNRRWNGYDSIIIIINENGYVVALSKIML